MTSIDTLQPSELSNVTDNNKTTINDDDKGIEEGEVIDDNNTTDNTIQSQQQGKHQPTDRYRNTRHDRYDDRRYDVGEERKYYDDRSRYNDRRHRYNDYQSSHNNQDNCNRYNSNDRYYDRGRRYDRYEEPYRRRHSPAQSHQQHEQQQQSYTSSNVTNTTQQQQTNNTTATTNTSDSNQQLLSFLGTYHDKDVRYNKNNNNERNKRQHRVSTDIRYQHVSSLHRQQQMLTAEQQLTSGKYIPPHQMKQLIQQIQNNNNSNNNDTTDNNKQQQQDDLIQRLQFDKLRKFINGSINKINADNIQYIVTDIFNENIIRGRGLLCQALINSQLISISYTAAYACFIAVINTKLPEIGELLLKRLITNYQNVIHNKNITLYNSITHNNQKNILLHTIIFIAHCINRYICHEIIGLQIITYLLENYMNNKEYYIELCIEFIKHVGQRLFDIIPQGMISIFDTLRNMLHNDRISDRIKQQIEELIVIRRNEFSDYPAIQDCYDLIDINEQITHELMLDDTYGTEENLNMYQYDNDYKLHEKQWNEIKLEIVGETEEVLVDDNTEQVEDNDVQQQEYADNTTAETGTDTTQQQSTTLQITDMTEADTVNLRRSIYLTIMSSITADECVHKLLKLLPNDAHQKLLCDMIIECCSIEKIYLSFYGQICERLCTIKPKIYISILDEIFAMTYANANKYETSKLRNIAQLYAYLLYTNSIEWSVLEYILLTETTTNSAIRIFVKFLFRSLVEHIGLIKLKNILDSEPVKQYTHGIYPTDAVENIRFSINYFTSIGLGLLSETMREYLAKQPTISLQQQIQQIKQEQDISSDSDSSSSSSSESDSESDSDTDTSSTNRSSSDSRDTDSSSDSSSSSSDSDSTSSDSDSDRHRKRRRKNRSSSRRRQSKRSKLDSVQVKQEDNSTNNID